MNCCDEYGHCRQGRDCPVRIEHIRQAKARLDREVRPPWLAYLPHLVKWMLIVLTLLLALALAGCAAPQLRETCGTLPDGSGYCVLVKGVGHA